MKDTVSLTPAIEPKGVVTVELFDGDGQMIERVHSNNFIAKSMNFFYRMLMISVFTRSKKTGGMSDRPIGNPFGMMTLSTNQDEPNPNTDWLSKGSLIGFGYTDNTYDLKTSTLQGQYNELDSGLIDDRLRIVMDFTTNAANGLIGSVYFGHKFGNSAISEYSPGTLAPFGVSMLKIEKYNNKYYVLVGTGSIGRQVNVYGETFNLEQTYSLNSTAYDFTIYNNEIYLAEQQYGSSIRVRKVPLSNPAAVSIPVGFTEGCYGITFDQTREQFIVRGPGSQYGSTQPPRYVAVYDKTFKPLSNYMMDEWVVEQRADYNESHFKMFNYKGLLFDRMATITPEGSAVPHGSGITPAGVIDDMLVTSDGRFVPLHGFSSHFKLPSPVTKTASNTMKVTYDFILPSPYA